MNESATERIRNLKAQLDTGAITASERSELAGLLRAQPAAGREIAVDIIIDRMLRQAVRGIDDERFIRGIGVRIDAERRPSGFIRRVANDQRLRPKRSRSTREGANSRSWAIGLALAAGLVVLVILGGTLWQKPLPDGDRATLAVVEVVGEATIDHQPLRQGSPLSLGSTLRCASGARVLLETNDGSTIQVAEAATLRVDDLTKGLDLHCERGQLLCVVRKQPANSSLRIHTPHGVATVIGTRFSLGVGNSTQLQVEAGTVELLDAGNGSRRRVEAGGAAEAFGTQTIAEHSNVVACYDFRVGRAGTAALIPDRARRLPRLDLTISHPERVEWLVGDGLRLQQSVVIASQQPAGKIIDACRASGELSIVAVVTADPRNLAATGETYPKRIVGLTGGTASRNFTLGQGLFHGTRDVIDLRLRTSTGHVNGKPSITSADPVVASRRQHIVFTRSADGRCRLYIDGNVVPIRQVDDDLEEPQRYRSTAAREQILGGDLTSWHPDMRLYLGAEFDRAGEPTRDWLGVLHGIAIFDRSLSADEVGVLARRGW